MSERPTHITRSPKNAENPYFMYRRDTAQDKSLSWAARGVLAYLLSKPDDWIVQVKDLQQECKREKVYSILDELEKAHYLTREEKQSHGEKGQFGPWIYHIHEIPCAVLPTTVSPDTVKPTLTYKRESQTTDSTEDSLSQVANAPATAGESETPDLTKHLEEKAKATQIAQPQSELNSPNPPVAPGPPSPFRQTYAAAPLDLVDVLTEREDAVLATQVVNGPITAGVPLPIQHLRVALPGADASRLDHLTALVGMKRIAMQDIAAYKPGEIVPTAIGELYALKVDEIGPGEAVAWIERLREMLGVAPPGTPKGSGDVHSTPASEVTSASQGKPVPQASESTSKSRTDNLPPAGYEWRGVAFVRHLVRAATADPLAALLCKLEYNGMVSTGPDLSTFTPCLTCLDYADKHPPKADPKPAINNALKDAIAEHVQGIKPALAGRLTGLLASMAAGIWKKRLSLDKLNAEQYAAAARSIPVFVEWYRLACVGCNLPQSLETFENWYSKFPPDWKSGTPAAPNSASVQMVDIPHPNGKPGITKAVPLSQLKNFGMEMGTDGQPRPIAK